MSGTPQFELVTLRSGGKSLRSIALRETFHPGIGPLEEARILHVEQNRLRERATAQGRFVLWDVGLGAAANAIAAIHALRDVPAEIEIHSFDKTTAPLEFALAEAQELLYPLGHRGLLDELLLKGSVQVREGFRWQFHAGDFRETLANSALPDPDSVFYDPYSPLVNREMWDVGHFTRLRERISSDCLMTTYTRSTAVRVSLLLAGFQVGAGCIIGEKAETTIAATRPGRLDRPLDRDWFKRVRISRNAAPMRDGVNEISPISAEDFARLEKHSQFL